MESSQWPGSIGETTIQYRAPIREASPLSAAELIELAMSSADAETHGRLVAIDRARLPQRMGGEDFAIGRQRQLVGELLEQTRKAATGTPQSGSGAVNPVNSAQASWHVERGDDGKAVIVEDARPLGPVDLAWALRIADRHPDSVSDEDAGHLATLAARAKLHQGSDPGSSDSRLLEDILRPIAARYNLADRQAELGRLRSVRHVDPPASLVQVVGEAVRKEIPQLSESEARGRAQSMIEAARAERDAVTSRHIRAVEGELDRIKAATRG